MCVCVCVCVCVLKENQLTNINIIWGVSIRTNISRVVFDSLMFDNLLIKLINYISVKLKQKFGSD